MPRCVQFPGVLRATRRLWKAAVAAASLAAAGCSVLAPFESAPSARMSADASITTGSIGPRPPDAPTPAGLLGLLSAELDQEDRRRAGAALATALDPQGNGSIVRWDNSQSSAKGSFDPIGAPYLVKDEICRSFVTGLSLHAQEQWFEGSACRISASEWQIKDLKPWKRPG